MIHSIPNLFPSEIIEPIHNYLTNSSWKFGWKSNHNVAFGHWNQTFADHKIIENGFDTSEQLTGIFVESWQYLKQTRYSNHNLLRCYSNGHTHGVEGYPHFDSKRKQDITLIVYVNKNWRRNYGGETIIYENNNIIHGELPSYNSGLEFPGFMRHCARSVSRICPELRMTLMYKMSPKDTDPTRDSVQTMLMEFKADIIPHGKRKLINHLLATYDLLRYCQLDQTTCIAGAFHSIFGTNSFNPGSLPQVNFAELTERIGPESSQLVRLFSKLDRPSTLNNALKNNSLTLTTTQNDFITVTQEQLHSLVAIEAANLYEQSSLDPRFSAIQSYWQSIYDGRFDP